MVVVVVDGFVGGGVVFGKVDAVVDGFVDPMVDAVVDVAVFDMVVAGWTFSVDDDFGADVFDDGDLKRVVGVDVAMAADVSGAVVGRSSAVNRVPSATDPLDRPLAVASTSSVAAAGASEPSGLRSVSVPVATPMSGTTSPVEVESDPDEATSTAWSDSWPVVSATLSTSDSTKSASAGSRLTKAPAKAREHSARITRCGENLR